MFSLHRKALIGGLIALTTLALTSSAHAEKADRKQPVNLEADKVSVDDRNRLHIFEGNVTLTQGTLEIRADKIVVTQDTEGFQKGIATSGPGGLARFKQKREGRDDYVEGQAERIEHNNRNEITEFFKRAYVKSGQDEVRGEYVTYNSLTENYTVTGGENKTVPTQPGQPAPPGQRVRAVITPKSAEPAPPRKD